jgi:hypothetical protein
MTGVEPYSFDDSRTTLAARTAVVVAAFAALLLGVTSGYPVQTVLGVAGGLAFGVAARDVAADSLRERVRGSALLMVASVLVVVALALQKADVVDAVLVGSVPAAVGATTLAAVVDPDEAVKPVFGALARSFVATLLGTFLASALYADVFVGTATASWGVYSRFLSELPMFGFVALQIGLVVLALVATRAARAAATFDPARSTASVSTVGLRDVPRIVWVLLAVQLFAVGFPGGSGLYSLLLAAAGPVGAIVGAVLSSVYLHAALWGLVGVLAVVPLGALARAGVVRVVGSRAPKTFAFATGGVGLSALVIVITSIPGVAGFVAWFSGGNEGVTRTVDAYGLGPATLAAVTGVLLVMGVVLFLYVAAFELPFVPRHASGFVFGALGLFVAAVSGAFAGAPAPAVFVAMAAAIAVWDVGEFAVTLGAELGQAANTRTVEAVHGLATLCVGALAVVVAALATHFFVPVMTGVPEQRALTALGLLCVALVGFAYAVNASGEGSSDAQ